MARRNKSEERAIAMQRVRILIDQAERALRERLDERAHRYAELAWRVKTTYQLRRCGIEPRICRACHAFLVPGRTSRVRLSAGRRVTTCLRCGGMRRVPLKAPRPPPRARPTRDGAQPPPTRDPAG